MGKPASRQPDVSGTKHLARAEPTRLATTTCCAILASLLAACFVLRPDIASAAQQSSPVKPADTSSPRATLKSFIDSCNEVHKLTQEVRYFDRRSAVYRPGARRILDCLDDSGLPDYARDDIASEAALCLKEILDRIELPPDEEIPDTEAIEAAGGPEKLSRWQIPGSRLTIARVREGPRQHEYLFTPGTVERAVEYYQDVKDLPYRTTGPEVSEGFYRWYVSAPGHPAVAALVDRLPEWTREQKFGLAVWQWAGLLLALPIAVLLMAAAYWLQGSIAGRFREKRALRYFLTILFPIGAMLIPLAFKHFARHYLTLRGTPLYVLSFSANLTTLLAALVVIFAASNRIAEIVIASPRIHPQGLDAQLIRIVSKLLSLVASVIIFLEGGRYLGIPVTTLLASAGVGSLAVALAAQDTLKALFGTVTLMADKPFRVGERIIFQKYDGVVEDIGLRSTRMRLLTGHQATIPNDELARTDIENVGRRPHIRRIADLHVPLDTPREKIEKAVAVVRAALENHAGMDPEFPPRIYFNEFNPDSFNIRLIYWYSPPNYWDFLEFSQQLNIRICRAFEEQGIPFSLPLRVAHTSVDSQEKPLQVKLVEQRGAASKS